MKKKIIALIGRPNVGKSTLFNRLAINSKAIVHDIAGVTRDRKYADARIGPFEFIVIDTPGLEEEPEDKKLEHRMMSQTLHAIKEADLICLMMDAKEHLSPTDKFFANFVRKHSSNCILVANKAEKSKNIDSEYYKLGFGDVVAISAEHALGMMDLYEAIQTKLFKASNDITDVIPNPINSDFIQIAVVGRPNAGKSTFINAILKENRMLTGHEAGITRESVIIDYVYNNTHIKLIDTAGLRKRKLITDNLEKLSASDTIRSINFANVVVLMVDSQIPLEQQDLKIASRVIEEGRGLVIAINKSDLIASDLKLFKKEIDYKINKHLGQTVGLPIIFISALNKQNIYNVLNECVEVYVLWNKKIQTGKLNNWLMKAVTEHQPPVLMHNRRLKIKYITQIKTRPPTFKLFVNNIEQISDNYKRYLINSMRTNLALPAVPIRLVFSKSKNPYINLTK